MKRTIAILLIVGMCLCFAACGKSDAAKLAEEAIASIGEVTAQSGDAIANAEKLYGILTDAEKATVENRLDLVEAREAFEEIKGEVVYENAKEAYVKLKEVSELCVAGMDAVYGAWHFGIYEADDTYSFDLMLSLETPGFSSEDIKAARELLGFSETSAKNDWQNSLEIVITAIAMRGDYDIINANMAEAEKVLQSLTEEYDDYTYYPKLKEYYAAIKSYVAFFTNPTGSFDQLADTVNNYENGIRTLESDVGFLFNKSEESEGTGLFAHLFK